MNISYLISNITDAISDHQCVKKEKKLTFYVLVSSVQSFTTMLLQVSE